MDNPTRRAATIAANKLLAAAGFDRTGLSLLKAKRKAAAKERVRQAERRNRAKKSKHKKG